jgi:single-strand DNA-binding protein
MPNLNKAMIIGHLGRDAELKTVGAGQVCNFSVATTEKWKDQNGQPKERTDWHNIQVWGKPATWAAELKKGDAVFVEGSLVQDEWTDKQGNKRTSIAIRAQRFQSLAPRAKSATASVSVDDIPFSWMIAVVTAGFAALAMQII